MKQNTFSIPFILIATIIVFGITSAIRVLAQDTAPTSTTVDNEAPVFTVDPSDNGSDGTTPTNEGENVTFTATGTDPNGNDYYLAICQTNAISAGSGTAPTCPGSAWGISSATTSGLEATVTYTTTGAEGSVGECDVNGESCPWYAFVCDGNGSPGLCSSSSQGSTSPSPFNVNHAGTFGPVTVTDTLDGTIEPGDTAKFTLLSVDSSDTDGDTLQDYFFMYICDRNTTSFDYTSNTCIGGISICSTTAFYPGVQDGSCTADPSLTSVPIAAGNHQYKVYIEDNHGLPATGTELQSYQITDVDPVISGAWIVPVRDPIAAGGSAIQYFSVPLSDDNGDNDVFNVEGVFFNASSPEGDLNDGTNNCTADDNDCYIQTSCTLTGISTPTAAGTKTSQGLDPDLTADCEVTVRFNAYAGSDWEFHVDVIDLPANLVEDLPDTNGNYVVDALSAIGVTESTIAYGTVPLGGDSSFQLTNMENAGNQILDVLVHGLAMTSGGNTIPAAQQKWDHSGLDFDWSTSPTAYNLVTSASVGDDLTGCLNRDMAVRQVHNVGTEDEPISWKIRIPGTQAAGSYSGVNTFAATNSASCIGILY